MGCDGREWGAESKAKNCWRGDGENLYQAGLCEEVVASAGSTCSPSPLWGWMRGADVIIN